MHVERVTTAELSLQKQLLHVLFVINVGPTANIFSELREKYFCNIFVYTSCIFKTCILQIAPTNWGDIVSRESSSGDVFVRTENPFYH